MQRSRHPALGLVIALVSAATFATSGAFAKPLLLAGWSPGLVVALRITLAAACLLVPSLRALRTHGPQIWAHRWLIAAYGAFAVAGCQLTYFNAVRHLSVGVALLLEYLAPTLIVLLVWLRTGRAPNRLTGAGVVASLLGLVLVLDVTGGARVSGAGLVWGMLAACCLVVYFVLGAKVGEVVPPLAMAGLGLAAGASVLWLAGLVGALDMHRGASLVDVAGHVLPWWACLLVIGVVAGAVAYVTGIAAVAMLGATVSSFVALTEVLFAVVVAWLVLGELPTWVQLGGGALVLAGVVLVRTGGGESAPEPIASAAAGEPVLGAAAAAGARN